MAQNPRPRTSTTDDAQQEEAAALAEFAAADDTASDDDQTDAYGEPEDTTSDAPEFDDGLTGIAAIDENLTRLAGGASLAGASAGIDLQSAIDSVSEAFAPPQQQAPAAPPQAPTRQVAQLETESPATPEQAQAPDEDPLATRVAKIAPNITVTPEMVAAFKAENPLFAQYDDAQAGEVLKEIIARGIAQDEADREAATTEQGQDPEAQAQAGTQDATAAANAEKPYSLWEDVKGLPKAIGAGVVKSGLESYDLVNETVLGNAPNYSDWRRGFEGYYSNLGGVSGAAASVAQFGAAFVGVGKFAKLAKIPGLARGATTAKGIAAQGAAKGFAADYMAFDGMEGRLSDLVEQYPHLQNPITGYLATDENDTQAEGRLKNALEGLGIGATIDVVMSGMRAYRAHLKGDKAGVDAAIEEGSAHFDTLNKKAESVESQPKPEPVASETQPKPDAAAKGDSTATPQPEPGTAGGAQVSSTGIATPEQIRASEEAKAGAEGATKAGATSTGTGGPRFVSPEIEAKARELAERIGKMDAAGSTDIVEYDEALRGTERRQPTPSTFESFTSEADLRALIGTVEDEVLKGIDSSHTATGRISHKETQRLAQQFANDIEDDWGLLVERMSKDGDTMARLEARFVAYGRVTADLAQRVQDMAWNVQQFDKVGAGAFGSKAELEKAFAHNLALYAQLQDHLKGARAGTGRALAIMRYDEALRKGVKLSLDPDDLSATDWANGGAKEIAEKVLRARDHKSLAMIADPTKYAQARDALTSLYIKNILSGPVTHLVNIFGNTYAAIAHPAAKIVGGAVERDPKIMREGLKQYGFMVSESLNALHIAFDALKTGDNFLDPHRSKFTPDGRFPEALSASALSGGAVPDESVTGRALNFYFSALGKVSTDALGASDEFFKQTLYSSELAARAWSEGVDRGLKGAELKSFVRKQIDDGFVVEPLAQGEPFAFATQNRAAPHTATANGSAICHPPCARTERSALMPRLQAGACR